jgi:hypothetical protein
LLVFEATFAKPETDAREDKKSLSKSISNGLKRYNKKTRRVVVRLLLLSVESVKEGKVSGREEAEGIIDLRRRSQNFAPRPKGVRAILESWARQD